MAETLGLAQQIPAARQSSSYEPYQAHDAIPALLKDEPPSTFGAVPPPVRPEDVGKDVVRPAAAPVNADAAKRTPFLEIRNNVYGMLKGKMNDSAIELYLTQQGLSGTKFKQLNKAYARGSWSELSKSFPELDGTTGAPKSISALVGAAPPEGRLSTLQKWYPDAVELPHDPGNYAYTDPATGKVTLYNPKTLDLRDVASVTGEAVKLATMTGGAAAGAVAGAPATPAGSALGSIAGAGVGAAAGNAAVNLVARMFGMVDPRSLTQILGDLGAEGVMGGAAQAVGMLAGGAGRGLLRSTFRGGETGRAGVANSLADFAATGATPTVGQASPKLFAKWLEGALSKIPGGYNILLAKANETQAAFKKTIDGMSSTLASGAPLGTETGGNVLKKGIDQFVGTFKGTGGALYGKLDSFVKPDDLLSAATITKTLRTITGESTTMPAASGAFASPKAKQLLELLGDAPQLLTTRGEALPWQVLQTWRSRIGERLAGGELIGDLTRGEMKQLYGAITTDMVNGLKTLNPKALPAFNRATKYWRAGIQRIDETLQPLVDRGVPEQVFKALEGAEPSTIRTVRKSITPDQWNYVAGVTLQRLGRPTPGEADEFGSQGFNVLRFLTRWNQLGRQDPKALDAFFEGTYPQMRANLNKIAAAASDVKSSGRMFANPSGTAQATMGGAALTALLTGVVYGEPSLVALVGLGAVSSAGGGKLMASPGFVRWLARSTELAPNGFGAHLSKLSAVAQESDDPEFHQALSEYIQQFATGTDKTPAPVAKRPTPVPFEDPSVPAAVQPAKKQSRLGLGLAK